jgi:hypothetical protein
MKAWNVGRAVSVVTGLVVSCLVVVGVNQVGMSSASAATLPSPLFYETVDVDPGELLTDDARGVIYASVKPTSAEHPNSIVTIDTDSAEITASTSIGSSIGPMAMSDNGSSLYVGLTDLATIRQYRLPDMAVVREFPMGSFGFGPLTANDLLSVPGQPDSIVVAATSMSVQMSTVAVFDAGTKRGTNLSFEPGSAVLEQGAAANRVYMLPAGGGGLLRRLVVSTSGVAEESTAPGLLGASFAMRRVEGRLFGADGSVADAEAGLRITQLAVGNGQMNTFAINPSSRRMFVTPLFQLGSFPGNVPRPLKIFDIDSLTLVDEFSIYGTGPGAYSMTTWGASGIAFSATPPPGQSGRPFVVVADLNVNRGAAGEYHPLSPTRILDTRSGLGRSGRIAKLGPGEVITATVAGVGGVPLAGVESVVLNVTATNPTSASFLSVWPAGFEQPDVSNLNFVAGQTVPNLVTVSVSSDGAVSVFNERGSTDLIFDVAGYYSTFEGSRGDRFRAITPTRLLDTRSGLGHPKAPIRTTPVDLQVTGTASVPAAGVSAVVMNVTVTNPNAVSFLTVYPSGQQVPDVSNLNFVARQTVPNLVIVKVPPSGLISLVNAFGTVDVIADVVGYYDNDRSNERGRFISFEPFRWFDSRTDQAVFGGDGKLNDGDALIIGPDPSWANAYVLNATVTGAEGAGFVTAYPSSAPLPNASNVNYTAGQTVPNHVIVSNAPRMLFEVSGGRTHLIVDVFGAFT